jgi:hypothetical protein
LEPVLANPLSDPIILPPILFTKFWLLILTEPLLALPVFKNCASTTDDIFQSLPNNSSNQNQ